MTFSRQFLLGLAVLGLRVGIAAAEPAAATVPAPPELAVVAPPALGAANPCCEGGCDREAVDRRGFLGGVGLYLIKPYFENNPAFIVNDGRPIPGTNPPQRRVATSEHVDIDHDLEVAPLLWLGYIGENGLGGRARYWYFRAGTSQSLPSPNRIVTAHPAGLSLIADQARELSVTSKLEVQALDLEGLQDLRVCGWDLLLSAGLRLARTSQAYNAFVVPSDGGVLSLLSGHSFQGVGPVLAGEARRPLRGSGLVLFGNARGSMVFGGAEQSAFIPIERNQGTDHRTRGLLIGELE